MTLRWLSVTQRWLSLGSAGKSFSNLAANAQMHAHFGKREMAELPGALYVEPTPTAGAQIHARVLDLEMADSTWRETLIAWVLLNKNGCELMKPTWRRRPPGSWLSTALDPPNLAGQCSHPCLQ
jgi:hypothetical protein